MGWLVSTPPLTHETPAEYLTREYAFESPAQRTEVLAAAQVGGAVYLAVRRTENQGERAGRSYVFCAVVLVFNNAREGFGRKAMDESCGPYEVDCPARILRLLSPVEEIPNPGYAAEWRARVAAHATRRREVAAAIRTLRPGQRVRLARPLTFDKKAVSADEFEVVPTPAGRRGPVFRPVGQAFLCRLPDDLVAEALKGDASTAPTQPALRP
ncbi:putative cytosolic protein (plasmid) [Roseomonas mucosa]|uniref:DUF6927 domain-containing protein n=1 Tax=Roseomonas mucosa TaxID=207340 RepID=UPI002208A644|nr:hypothetical protein [Roseomonas mucosa]QDJ12267.1 putative cytosolic protein [Roseomonas mucosa]